MEERGTSKQNAEVGMTFEVQTARKVYTKTLHDMKEFSNIHLTKQIMKDPDQLSSHICAFIEDRESRLYETLLDLQQVLIMQDNPRIRAVIFRYWLKACHDGDALTNSLQRSALMHLSGYEALVVQEDSLRKAWSFWQQRIRYFNQQMQGKNPQFTSDNDLRPFLVIRFTQLDQQLIDFETSLAKGKATSQSAVLLLSAVLRKFLTEHPS